MFRVCSCYLTLGASPHAPSVCVCVRAGARTRAMHKCNLCMCCWVFGASHRIAFVETLSVHTHVLCRRWRVHARKLLTRAPSLLRVCVCLTCAAHMPRWRWRWRMNSGAGYIIRMQMWATIALNAAHFKLLWLANLIVWHMHRAIDDEVIGSSTNTCSRIPSTITTCTFVHNI